MARRRRFRRRAKTHSRGGVMHWVNKLIAPAAFGIALTTQVSSKDIANYGQSQYQALTNTQKAQFLGNSLANHFTGFAPYPQYGTPGITINPTGPINKFTGMGIGLMILGHVLPGKLGGKTQAYRAGKGLFWGGVIGGFFDPGSGSRSGGMASRGAPGGLAAIGARGAGAFKGGAGPHSGSYLGTGSSAGY